MMTEIYIYIYIHNFIYIYIKYIYIYIRRGLTKKNRLDETFQQTLILQNIIIARRSGEKTMPDKANDKM